MPFYIIIKHKKTADIFQRPPQAIIRDNYLVIKLFKHHRSNLSHSTERIFPQLRISNIVRMHKTVKQHTMRTFPVIDQNLLPIPQCQPKANRTFNTQILACAEHQFRSVQNILIPDLALACHPCRYLQTLNLHPFDGIGHQRALSQSLLNYQSRNKSCISILNLDNIIQFHN